MEVSSGETEEKQTDHLDKVDFFDTQCRRILFYGRLFFAILLFVIVIISLATYPGFFLMLTNWSTLLCAIYYILIVLHYRYPKLKFACLLAFETAWAFEFAIMIVFWGFLFAEYVDKYGVDYYPLWVGGLLAHLALLIVLYADFLSCRIVFKKRHLLLPYGIGLLYLIVNASWTLTQDQIYPLLNYVNAWSYVMMAFIIFSIWLSFVLTDWLLILKRDYNCNNVTLLKQYEASEVHSEVDVVIGEEEKQQEENEVEKEKAENDRAESD